MTMDGSSSRASTLSAMLMKPLTDSGGGGISGNDLMEQLLWSTSSPGINNSSSSSLSSSSSSSSITAGTDTGTGTLGDGGSAILLPAHMSLIMTVACSIILVVGLVGNCLVPVVIWNNRDLRNSTNLFLLNLSLADILVLCVSMPTVLVEIHTGPEIWILGQIMCKLVPFVELAVAHASVLTIMAISLERYYVITRPLRAGYTCTRMRALAIILAIWILGSLTSSPMVFIASYTEEEVSRGGVPTMETTCVSEATTFWPIFYFIGVMCLLFFFPLLVLIAIYTVIARHLVADPVMQSSAGGSGGTAGRSQRIQVHQSNSSANAGGGGGSSGNGGGGENVNPNLRARRQVVVMLGTVVVFFFVCLLPFRLFTLWVILTPDEIMKNMSIETYYHALNFCRVMLYLNSAINPILYNVMSSKFRAAFLKALGLTWAGRRKRLLRHLSRQSTFNTTGTSSETTTTTDRERSGGSMSSSSHYYHNHHHHHHHLHHHHGIGMGIGGGRSASTASGHNLTKEALLAAATAASVASAQAPPTFRYGRHGSCIVNHAAIAAASAKLAAAAAAVAAVEAEAEVAASESDGTERNISSSTALLAAPNGHIGVDGDAATATAAAAATLSSASSSSERNDSGSGRSSSSHV